MTVGQYVNVSSKLLLTTNNFFVGPNSFILVLLVPIMHSITLPLLLCATGVLSQTSKQYKFDPLEHLAGVAPPFDPQDPPLDPSPPQGCNVTRAAYLVRHAAIFANDFDYESYIEPFVQKLASFDLISPALLLVR